MNRAFPDARVEGFESLEEGLELPDPDDRHVLAAAIRGHVDVLVTSNLKDFPPRALRPYELEAMRPDAFVMALLEERPTAVIDVVRQQAADKKRPPVSFDRLLDALVKAGLPRTVSEIRRLVA